MATVILMTFLKTFGHIIKFTGFSVILSQNTQPSAWAGRGSSMLKFVQLQKVQS